jgi:hypothetical protein
MSKSPLFHSENHPEIEKGMKPQKDPGQWLDKYSATVMGLFFGGG